MNEQSEPDPVTLQNDFKPETVRSPIEQVKEEISEAQETEK